MREGASQKGLSAAPAGQTVGLSTGNTDSAETTRSRKAQATPGLEFPRFFSTAGVDPFDEIEWDLRDAIIGNEKGAVVFEQRGVEIPKSWSQQATNIVVSKYFRGHVGSPDRERSVKQLIGRVVNTITEWARKQKYFASEKALLAFSDDLKYLLVHQQAAFNSPVWFNCGFEKAPQCSACFINSVDDTMVIILVSPRPKACCSSSAPAPAATLFPPARPQGLPLARRGRRRAGAARRGHPRRRCPPRSSAWCARSSATRSPPRAPARCCRAPSSTELLGGGAHAAAVIEKLVAARLLVVSESEAGGERIEVTHEALLDAWPRLVAWRREDAEGARLRDQLRAAARQWDERGRPSGLLWRGDALAEYRLWRARYPGAPDRPARRRSPPPAWPTRRAAAACAAACSSAPSSSLVAVAVVLLVQNARVERAAQRARSRTSAGAGEPTSSTPCCSASTRARAAGCSSPTIRCRRWPTSTRPPSSARAARPTTSWSPRRSAPPTASSSRSSTTASSGARASPPTAAASPPPATTERPSSGRCAAIGSPSWRTRAASAASSGARTAASSRRPDATTRSACGTRRPVRSSSASRRRARRRRSLSPATARASPWRLSTTRSTSTTRRPASSPSPCENRWSRAPSRLGSRCASHRTVRWSLPVTSRVRSACGTPPPGGRSRPSQDRPRA